MATLQEMLLAPHTAPHVIADCQALIESELDSKSGLSATAVKGAYKVVSSLAPGYYTKTLHALVPDMIQVLEPFWADFLYSGGADFGDYLAKRGDEVSEAMLSVTDYQANMSTHPTVVKAYKMVRGSAGKNIEAALPALGAMLQKYA